MVTPPLPWEVDSSAWESFSWSMQRLKTQPRLENLLSWGFSDNLWCHICCKAHKGGRGVLEPYMQGLQNVEFVNWGAWGMFWSERSLGEIKEEQISHERSFPSSTLVTLLGASGPTEPQNHRRGWVGTLNLTQSHPLPWAGEPSTAQVVQISISKPDCVQTCPHFQMLRGMFSTELFSSCSLSLPWDLAHSYWRRNWRMSLGSQWNKLEILCGEPNTTQAAGESSLDPDAFLTADLD